MIGPVLKVEADRVTRYLAGDARSGHWLCANGEGWEADAIRDLRRDGACDMEIRHWIRTGVRW